MKELPFGSKFKLHGARFLSTRNKNAPGQEAAFEFRSQQDQALTKFFRCAGGDTPWSAMRANPISVAVEFPLSELPRGAL